MTSKVSMRCCCAREISRTGTLDVDVAMSMLGDVLDVDVNCDVGCAVPKFRSLKVAPVVHSHGHGHGNVRVAVDRDPTHNVERSYVEYSNVSELRSSRGAARPHPVSRRTCSVTSCHRQVTLAARRGLRWALMTTTAAPFSKPAPRRRSNALK